MQNSAGLIIFILLAIILTGAFLLINMIIKAIWDPELKRVRSELKNLSTDFLRAKQVDIGKKESLSDVPWLNQLLLSLQAPLIKKLSLYIKQADSQYPLGFYILLTAFLALTGFILIIWTMKSYPLALIVSIIAGSGPFVYILIKRGRRMKKFDEQLPDALDLIARALKAGQAFTGGLKMVTEEFDPPLGSEFETTLSQINLGVSLQDALRNLVERFDNPDLKFFALALIIQRQCGGNLAEILENISRLIRERFKLRDRIRALAAEGKISAIILIALPFFIVLALTFLSPDYIKILVIDPIGKKMIYTCLFMMAIGVFVIKKMITIKV